VRFVLAIETVGMLQRLNYYRFRDTADCIIVEMGGVPIVLHSPVAAGVRLPPAIIRRR